jgi:metallo-beta-lactamase family protein
VKLTFWGAAQTVTGSMHHLTVQDQHYLLDCGTYQGHRTEAWERNSRLPFSATSIHAVMLSHAHLDHSGCLPTLAGKGFSGPIYTSPATASLREPMLLDSAHIQTKDGEYLNKVAARRRSLAGKNRGEEVKPLYDDRDVEEAIESIQSIGLHTPTEVGPGGVHEAFDAGHKDLNLVADKLADAINRACARGGRIIVPAFAVGRTQQLVLLLHQLIDKGRIPSIPMFVDSPLAGKISAVYRRHSEALDRETTLFMESGTDPFGFRLLRYVEDVNESKGLNDLKGPFVVISASGMCEAGRILHHLKNNIGDPRNLILITGFEAENTLGRKIVDGLPEVPIFGDMYPLRAEVVKLNELSGHADQKGLLEWLKPVAPDLKKVFLVHGELPAQKALADAIQSQYGLKCGNPLAG